MSAQHGGRSQLRLDPAGGLSAHQRRRSEPQSSARLPPPRPPAPAAGPTARPGRAGDFPEAAGRSQGLSSLHACQAAAGACGLAALPGPEPEAHEAATRAYQPGGGRHPEDAELGGHPTGPQGSSTPSQGRTAEPPILAPADPQSLALPRERLPRGLLSGQPRAAAAAEAAPPPRLSRARGAAEWHRGP